MTASAWDLASSIGPAPGVGGAPTSAPVARVRDVLFLRSGDHGTFDEFQAHPPAGEPPRTREARGIEIVEG